MVTIIGSVGTRSEKSLDQPEPREFELKTSVYDPPTETLLRGLLL